MLQRLYVHNFRCLENFEFKPEAQNSVLLIGKNGTGKSTIRHALRIFQRIGRGVNRIGQLLGLEDRTLGRSGLPVRLEMEACLEGQIFQYVLSLELPERFREFRILEEELRLGNQLLYARRHAEVTIPRDAGGQAAARFNIDWHLVALPVIQDAAVTGPIHRFRQWLGGLILLAPIPSLMKGEAIGESLLPEEDGVNLAEWLAGLLAQYPAAYTTISAHLQEVMPDTLDFRFERIGREAKSLVVRFRSGGGQQEQDFAVLSDGEKCFFLCAVVLAANRFNGPAFAFWDEPDNYLSLDEVSHFIMALRRSFHQGGQILMTSHNEETVRRFSGDNTWVLGRKSHLEPVLIRRLDEFPQTQDIIGKLILGDLEP